jgi:hypothetical protein
MKCNEVRELFSADPQSDKAEALQHIEDCSDCAEWLTELQTFEMALSEAMQVDIPEGLEARILQQYKTPQHGNVTQLHPTPPKQKWHPLLAMAASILLVIGVITSLNQEPVTALFEQQVVAWLETKQPVQYLDQQATDAEVEMMFKEVGAELVADVGTIHYCQITTVNEQKVGYFVISGEEGLVSVVLAADGSKNIFTQSVAGANNPLIEQRIKNSIRWI